MAWFNQLLAWLRGFFGVIFDTLKALFFWVWDYLANALRPLWEPVVNYYNQLADYLNIPSTAYLKDLWATADMWLPLSEGLQLATLFFGLQCVLIAIRTAKKFIPTLSG
jgi:hypothetical protein